MPDTPDTPAEGGADQRAADDEKPQPTVDWIDEPPRFHVVRSSIRERSSQKASGIALSESERVELEGRRAFFRLRSIWSTAIIAWISLLILFNAALTGLVGTGWLDFSNYQWFVTAVTVETFLQIVGMGYVAVRFLFSDGRRD